jgi:arylsulfatase/uncharacterized sulfatase
MITLRLGPGLALALALGMASISSGVFASDLQRPNLLIILADDLGFSDIAPYGSEINTPNLTALAQEGLRFSNYHTSPSCAPTRAMLLTGVDSHRAGVANIAEALTREQAGSPFYRGTLNKNVVTTATLLRNAGYHTYMSGKWHLGYMDKALLPINRGFERTVTMPYSGADNWSDMSYLPNYEKALWLENGEEITLPDDFYSSKFLVDKAIGQIELDRGDGKPFFSYLSFQAVHIPVQAPREYTEKYANTYLDGWTALRERRQSAVKAEGLIRSDAPMKTMPTTEDWDSLDAEEKRYNAKRMAVYAGMIDAMDANIGRLIGYLKEIGEYDNTVIIFTSDNGAEASDPEDVSGTFPLWMRFQGYNRDYETLGEKYSYNYIDTSFASAAAAPLGHYKFYAGEGGMRVPLIVTGPTLAAPLRGEISDAMAYVKDLAATVLAIAGVAHPGTSFQGREIEPMTGVSLLPILSSEAASVYTSQDVVAYEIGGNAALIKGDYKIIYNRGEAGDSQWHLYNIQQDPGETLQLEKSEPEIYADLLREYERYVAENGVLAVPDDYDQRKQAMWNGVDIAYIQPTKAFVSRPLFIASALVFAILLVMWRMARRRMRAKS